MLTQTSDLWTSRDSSQSYEDFGHEYWDDPVGFVHNCILWGNDERAGPTAYQEEVLESLVAKRRVSLRCGHGAGKCVSENSLIPVKGWGLVRAADLIGKSFWVDAVDDNLNVVEARAYAAANGVRPVVRITTENARVITRTLNHPLWACVHPRDKEKRLRPAGRWVEAGKLVEGSVVAVYLGRTQDEVSAQAVSGQTQQWRSFGLPDHLRWELVQRVERLPDQPTVAISVPGPETFLTDFCEHNTSLSSWAILWFALTRDALAADWKIPTTASAWRQLQKFLWPEVHKWARRLNWQKIGREEFAARDELQALSLSLNHGSAFALASNRSDLIEGAHADHLLYVFDESKVIPDATWDSAEGAMTAKNAMWLAVSTPGEPQGRFYHIHVRRPGTEDWYARHVTLQECIDAGRVSLKWANDRRLQWGEKSAEYQKRVLGEFAVDEVEGLIPLGWVEAAVRRWIEWERSGGLRKLEGAPDQIGVDVARSGSDDSVLALRYGNIISMLDIYSKTDTMEITGKISLHLKTGCHTDVQIDVIGIGSGVYDRLCELHPDMAEKHFFAFHAQEKTDFADKTGLFEFQDSYSAAWWNLREMLDPSNERGVMLPPNDNLVADLTAPKWRTLSSGKIQVERKEDVKRRLGRSPDAGDAVVMAFWLADAAGMEFA